MFDVYVGAAGPNKTKRKRRLLIMSACLIPSLFSSSQFPVLKTEATEAKLALDSCSKYIVGVGMTKANGVAQRPQSWLRIKTQYDVLKPPINPRMNVTNNVISFSWDHACNITGPNQQPPYYVFGINELTMNYNVKIRVDALSYRIRILKGREFIFSVSTPANGAVPTTWQHKVDDSLEPVDIEVRSSLRQIFEPILDAA